MKKERIETLTDSFVDEKGETRHFILAAISEVFIDFDEPAYVINEHDIAVAEVYKGIKLGFAICNPIDKFNEDLGKQIAIGRARKNREYALFATQLGYVNTTLVKAFLKQEAEYFKNNPERYIAGYKRK